MAGSGYVMHFKKRLLEKRDFFLKCDLDLLISLGKRFSKWYHSQYRKLSSQ